LCCDERVRRSFRGAASGQDRYSFAEIPDAIAGRCTQAEVTKLLPNALYVYRSALDSLGPLLRVYEGCARSYLGEVEGANVIKLHRHSGKVSYLVYPGFETDAHPALLRSIKLSLRTRELECFDYAGSANPPVLHREEAFLPADHPLHAEFAKLTQQEEKHGLLDDTATIGTREGWERRLAERGYMIRGHRLLRRREPNHESDESNE
jgi:DNA phosphorothioation-associated putative methyltransferase